MTRKGVLETTGAVFITTGGSLLVWVRKIENGKENSRLGSSPVAPSPAFPFGVNSQAEPKRRRREA